MPQLLQKAGASSKKYSFFTSSALRNPFAIGMRPNDMKGAMRAEQMRHWLIAPFPFSLMKLIVRCQDSAEIRAVVGIYNGFSKSLERCRVEETHAVGDLLRASN